MSRILYAPREQTRHRRRRASRRNAWKKVVGATILFFLIAGGSIYLLRLPYWRINQIEVRGIEALDEATLKSRIQAHLGGTLPLWIPRNNYFFAPTAVLATELRTEFPQIAATSVEKSFPRTLRIAIQERKLFGIFCPTPAPTPENTGEPPPCVFIDMNGLAYDHAPSSSGSLLMKIYKDAPEVQIGSRVLDPQLMQEMQNLRERLRREVELEVIEYQLLSRAPREIRLTTTEGFSLWFDRGRDLDNTLKVLKTVLDQEVRDRRSQLNYIDLRFGNKVFYKFKK